MARKKELGMRKAWRYFLVFSDGLVQEVDEDPQLNVGNLLGAQRARISEGLEGKYICTAIETEQEPDTPCIKRYALRLWEPAMV
jgi:hypothetical protein